MRILLLLVALLFGRAAWADGTIAPTTKTQWTSASLNGAWYDSPVASCDALVAVLNGLNNGNIYRRDAALTEPPYTCTLGYSPVGHPFESGWVSQQVVYQQARSVPSCPSNSTGPVDNQCTCAANYVPNEAGTACVPKPNKCAGLIAKPMGGGEFTAGAIKGEVPAKVCKEGCSYIPESPLIGGVWGCLNGTCHYVGDASRWIGDGTLCTGAPVGSPGDPPATPPQPDPDPVPKGKCPGEVNGVTVYVPCDSTSSKSGDSGSGSGSSSSGSGPGNGDPAGSSKSSTDTECSGASCTTTRTTTTQNGDGTSTTTTDSSTEDKGDYCAKHPGSAQCADEDDDDESDGECEKNPDLVRCAKLDQAPTAPTVTGVTLQAAITPESSWGADNAQCPGLVHTSRLGDVDVYGLFCQYAQGIRFAVIGFASLVAVLIFIGRVD